MVVPQSGAINEMGSVEGTVAREWDQPEIDVMKKFVVSADPWS
jgi:hypothetical protein